MRKKAIETVLGICLLISGMFIPMKNVEAFDTYTARACLKNKSCTKHIFVYPFSC